MPPLPLTLRVSSKNSEKVMDAQKRIGQPLAALLNAPLDALACPVELQDRIPWIKAQPHAHRGEQYAHLRTHYIEPDYPLTEVQNAGYVLDLSMESFWLTPEMLEYASRLAEATAYYAHAFPGGTILDTVHAHMKLRAKGLLICEVDCLSYGIPVAEWAVRMAQARDLKSTTAGMIYHETFPSIDAGDWHGFALWLFTQGEPYQEPPPAVPAWRNRAQQMEDLLDVAWLDLKNQLEDYLASL